MEMTTTTALQTPGDTSLIGLVAIVALIILLISREIALGLSAERERHWGMVLSVGIIPLAITFFALVFVKLSPPLP
jgi:hypothetical protein